MSNIINVNGEAFADDKIVSGNMLLVQSLDGDELQYNTLDATLELGELTPTLFCPADAPGGLVTSDDKLFCVRPLVNVLTHDPASYQYGAVVLVLHDGVQIGKFYMSSISRVGKTKYRIACVSAVGMLDNSDHYGGIYTSSPRVNVPALVNDIVGGIVPVSVAPEFTNTQVLGWLPVGTRRANLHQLLFAIGGAALRDNNGDLYIAPLYADSYRNIPDNRIYMSGTVDYPDAVTIASVSEHSFVALQSDAVVTLHDGEAAAAPIVTPKGQSVSGVLVLFSGPMHDLSITGSTIIESGVNYAVISNSTDCTLTGKAYTHTVRQIVYPDGAARLVSNKDNEVSVTDATLVNLLNSENVAKRLYDYYTSAKTVSSDIVLVNEKAGDAVAFNDAFGDATEGIIKEMDITLSTKLKARTSVISDYVPENPGNFYTNVRVFTSNGTFTVQSGTTKIRVVLIGGGNGGSSGGNGTAGGSSAITTRTSGDGGTGGPMGVAGSGGKVLVFTMAVTAGQSYSVVVGAGGAGGICTSTTSAPGTAGGNSTFAGRSSADGVSSETGFVDQLTVGGPVYGLPGVDGVAGGDGAGANNNFTGGGVTYGGVTYQPGANGRQSSRGALGGGGGGAAAGSNGTDGATSTGATGGNGGAGATATISGANGVTPGSGGSGGSGGGGGGGGGANDGSASGWMSSGGAAGNGSNGGNGKSGAVLVYY